MTSVKLLFTIPVRVVRRKGLIEGGRKEGREDGGSKKGGREGGTKNQTSTVNV